MLRTLLYGRNVDRNAKARARIGLAILAFGVVYSVIAVRLVMFAVVPESHFVKRGAGRDAVATARPDVLDRNGLILATDVRTPSLFAEPRRMVDVDEATELLTAVMPDLDAGEVRERLGSKRGFVWLKREITTKQRREIYRLGLPGVGFLAENKRVYPNSAEVSHLIGHVNIDNQGIAGIEKWLDGHGLQALHMAGLATDRLQKPVELAVDLRVQHALRDELIAARDQVQGQGRGRPRGRLRHRRDRRHGVAAGLRPQQPEAGQRSAAHQPPDHRRVRDGLDLQGADDRDGARFRQVQSELAGRCARLAALRQVQHRRLSRQEPGAVAVRDLHLLVQHRHRALALRLGVEHHKWFLRKLGQLDRLRTELPESAEPIVPKRWGELNTVTIAFGHGLSVAPLQAVAGINALVNGGLLIPPTFMKRSRRRAR